MMNHSFGSRSRGIRKVSSSFDPATLLLSGWWPASFGGSPWAGKASAGSSGGRDISEATNPPAVGSAVDGFTPADSDGTNDILSSALGSSSYFAENSMSGAVLVRLDAAGVVNLPLTPYNENTLMGSAGAADWGLSLGSVDGVRFWRQEQGAVGYGNVSVALAIDTWAVIQFKYDGTNLKIRKNNGAWTSSAFDANALSGTSQNVFFGHALSAFSNAKMLEIMWTDQVFSDATFDSIYSYLKARYPSTGLP